MKTSPITLGRFAAGALAAAVLGTSAGAALKPQPQERQDPAAPQQIIADDAALAGLERQGGGWPGRRQG